jgi:hypothetical protein
VQETLKQIVENWGARRRCRRLRGMCIRFMKRLKTEKVLLLCLGNGGWRRASRRKGRCRRSGKCILATVSYCNFVVIHRPISKKYYDSIISILLQQLPSLIMFSFISEKHLQPPVTVIVFRFASFFECFVLSLFFQGPPGPHGPAGEKGPAGELGPQVYRLRIWGNYVIFIVFLFVLCLNSTLQPVCDVPSKVIDGLFISYEMLIAHYTQSMPHPANVACGIDCYYKNVADLELMCSNCFNIN